MNVINFILANWDFILLIVAAVAAIIYAIFKGNKSVVMKMLYAMVTEAEKNMGGGTGSLKLASVIEAIYPKLPAVIKMFITDAMLKKWVEDALVLAKEPARAPAGESIEQRPAEIRSREQFGHWEMDTVYSAKTSSKKALLVLTERKTRWEIIIMIPNRKAETIVKALDALERRYGAVNFRKIFRSITVDNGSEFAMADGIERSAINKTMPRTKVYFCHPYSSWERGSNENQNLMIRRKHPKGTDFAKVTKAEIEATEQWINNYPRRILGYMSSEILFKQCLREIGVVA